MATPKKKNPKKAGRKTAYRTEYNQRMISFFDIESSREADLEYTDPKTGEVKSKIKILPNLFPTIERFAAELDVDDDTLREWRDKYPEFSVTYKKCKQYQKDFLIQNGLAGLYPPAAFIFVAKNCTDMRDKQEVEHSGGLQIVRAELPAKKPVGAPVEF